MTSSNITTNLRQVNANIRKPSTLASSTIVTPVLMNKNLNLNEATSSPLYVPPGWHSEIIHSNTPIPTNAAMTWTENINSAEDHSTTNVNDCIADCINRHASSDKLVQNYEVNSVTTNASQVPIQIINDNHIHNIHQPISNNSIHQENVLFTEQQQQNVRFTEQPQQNVLFTEQQQQNVRFTEQQQQNVRFTEQPQQNVLFTEQQQQNVLLTERQHQNVLLTEQQQQHIIHAVEHQNPPPLVIHKQLPNSHVTYQQNIAVRYLKPPTPPAPGPIIIREVRPPAPPPQSPIQIRQRPPPPPSQPPLILRERPPPLPPQIPAQVVEKVLPPPAQSSRRIIVERYPPCPPKPRDVIIERWLPYKQTNQRRVLIERASAPCITSQEPNLLILHDAPSACVRKEFINCGVVRTDPDCYMQQYGAEINRSDSSLQAAHIMDEAARAVPPSSSNSFYRYDDSASYLNEYECKSYPYVSNRWEYSRYGSPIPRSSTSYLDYSNRDAAYSRSAKPSYDYEYRHRDGYLTMTDVTSSWDRYCNSPPYARYSSSLDCYSSSRSHYSSSYPEKTIRVCSDNELNRVLSDLTNGRIPSGLC